MTQATIEHLANAIIVSAQQEIIGACTFRARPAKFFTHYGMISYVARLSLNLNRVKRPRPLFLARLRPLSLFCHALALESRLTSQKMSYIGNEHRRAPHAPCTSVRAVGLQPF